MNYLKVYCNLIRKAENRTPHEGYTEKHHTFPKSIFGKNNRIVVLTGREHYIAHALLEKVCIQRYGLKDNKTIKMNFAHISMKGNGRMYFNSRLYGSAKRRRSENMKGVKYSLGFKHTEETRKKQSKARQGMKWWNNGKIDMRSREQPGEEWKTGRLKVQVGRVCKDETKIKIGQKHKGKKCSKETRRKIGEWHKGKKRPEHSKKIKDNFNYFLKNGTLYEIISPTGEIGYTCRLKKFCEVNGLDRAAIGRVVNYQCRQHNGWIVNKIT